MVYYFNLFQITYYSCVLHLTFQDAKYNTLFQVFKLNLKVSKTIGVPKVHCLFFLSLANFSIKHFTMYFLKFHT